MRLLDTNILSEIIRAAPHPAVAAQLSRRRSTEVFASTVSHYELRYGAARRQDANRLWERLQREVLPVATWLPVTAEIAERGGEIAAELRRLGKPCGDLDPLLAATALVHGLVFVTRNVRHFQDIPGITLENWFGEAE
jgi:predicted nucleic acid-binding protein